MKLFYAGTFDPPHKGHLDLVNQCLQMGAEVIVGIGINEEKPSRLLSFETTINLWWDILADCPSDSIYDVFSYEGYTVDVAVQCGVNALVRGVRNGVDYEYERKIADFNRARGGLPTILLPSRYSYSSTKIRQLVKRSNLCTEEVEYLEAALPTPVMDYVKSVFL